MTGSGAGRGWAAIFALTLAAAAFASPVVTPVLLIFVPFGLLLLSEGPERLGTALFGAALLAITFAYAPPGNFWYIERGWTLVLAAWFVLWGAARPNADFFPRALGSVFAAALTTAAVFAIRGGWRGLDAAVATVYREPAERWAAAFQQVQQGSPAAGAESAGARLVTAVAESQAVVYPAFVALGSIAALAVAWWGARRLIHREPQPLRPLREFRFRDELVWGLIVGAVLWLAPLGAAPQRVGSNMLTFMAALYALRGAAVLLSLLGSIGPVTAALTLAALMLFYPVAVILGLTDTWLDFRTRHREANGVS